MHRFWATAVEPVLERLAPNVIVEVGAQSGRNTAQLLDYCARTGARCHVIDPFPPDNLEAIADQMARHGQYHAGLSLDVLPTIPGVDAYLIDGDHNWYTVNGELEAIAGVAGRGSRAPLIIFHDVDWPYAARDLYYDPSNIPAEHRHPYVVGGLKPGVREALVHDGLNDHLHHAREEGGARNGVQTAIRDFVGAHSSEWRFERLAGMNGLGFVVPRARAQEPFAEFIEALCGLSPTHAAYLERVEADRIEGLIDAAAVRRELRTERQMRRAAEAQVRELQGRLDAIEKSGGYRALQQIRGVRNWLRR